MAGSHSNGTAGSRTRCGPMMLNGPARREYIGSVRMVSVAVWISHVEWPMNVTTAVASPSGAARCVLTATCAGQGARGVRNSRGSDVNGWPPAPVGLKKRVPSKWLLGGTGITERAIDHASFNRQSAIGNHNCQLTRVAAAGERSAFPTTWSNRSASTGFSRCSACRYTASRRTI